MADSMLAGNPTEMRDIVKIKPAVRTEPYYLVLSKGFEARDPALAERIWNAIGEAARTPEYRALEKKYAVAS